MLRLACLACCLVAGMPAAERPTIVPETLHGVWVLDAKAVKPDQRAAADAAAAIEGYGLAFTQRICRVVLGDDRQFAGMWRIAEASATTATVVVQPRGGEEQRLTVAFDGRHLVITDPPVGLPLIKAPR